MGAALKGRTNRASYWVLLIGFLVVVYGIYGLTGKRVPVGEALLLFICVPRLHDFGWSGWWAGGVIIAEIAVALGALLSLPEDLATAVLGLYALLVVAMLVTIGLIPGQRGANRFGEQPAPGLSFGRPGEGVDKTFS